jgi:ribosomal-protein-serine acetyltransferase
MGIPRPVLRTQRLVLRPLQQRHAKAVYQAVDQSRRSLRRWLPFPDTTRSARDIATFIRRTTLGRGGIAWGIWLPEERRDALGAARACAARRAGRGGLRTQGRRAACRETLCGVVGLHGSLRTQGTAMVGYWVRRSQQGQGFATEATAAVALWAFGPLGVARLSVMAAPANHASVRVIRKVGFTREGVLRHMQLLPGRTRRLDWVVASIIRPELARVRPRLVRLCGRRRPWES